MTEQSVEALVKDCALIKNDDETWSRAVDSALRQFSANRRNGLADKDLRAAIDDALQHAVGIMQLRVPVSLLSLMNRLCAALAALPQEVPELASDHADIADRLGYIRAHRDEGGKFSDANGNELLGIAERLLKRANIWRDCFAEITAKATPFGAHQDDPERIVSYIIPCGPIHRAAGKTGFQFFNGEQVVDRWRERAMAAEAKLAAAPSVTDLLQTERETK